MFHRVCLRPVCLRSDDAKLIYNFVFHIKKANFMLQPDEETVSAGERPVSNMATPILITRTVRESSWWRLLFCFQAGLSAKSPVPLVRKQSLVAGYVGELPVKGPIFGDTAHQCQHQFFIGYGHAHAGHPPEA